MLLAALWLLPFAFGKEPDSYLIDSVAGSNDVGDGGPAVAAQLGAVGGLAVDLAGNVYIADNLDNRIRKVDAVTGRITTIAGNGYAGFAGDGGQPKQALLRRPYGLAVGPAGTLYVADFGNARVRRITPGGRIETVAGGGGMGGESTGALSARLAGPRNVALDQGGNLYISDFAGHRVYRVTPAGEISTVAGTGVAGSSGDGPAISAMLDAPAGLAIAPDGALYIADSGNRRVLKLKAGILTTVLGGADGGGIELKRPTGLAVDRFGALYVADSEAKRVIRRSAAGKLSIVADETAGLEQPRDVAAGIRGNLYVADEHRVFKIAGDGSLVPFAGDGSYGRWGEGMKAAAAYLDGPIGVATDASGNLFIAEEGRYRVRKVDAEGVIRTVAGNGHQGADGDGGPATRAELIDPVGVATDSLGRLWIADYLGNRIRRVGVNGIIETIAGNGHPGYDGDVNSAEASLLNRPRGIVAGPHGNLYIADSLNHRVRRIDAAGQISTVAGNGIRGYAGDGGLAVNAELDTPVAVAADAAGNVYIAEAGNNVVRKVSREGLISTVAGNRLPGYGGDGGPATEAELNFPSGIAADKEGYLWIADTNNHRVRRVAPDGIIETIAGNGRPGFSGDGAAATEAELHSPSGIALAPDGSIYIADLDNRRVRRLVSVFAPPVVEPVGQYRVVNGASFRPGPVAPGEIVTIFGSGLGPARAVMGQLTSAGLLSSKLGGTRVEFDGVPAPLFYVSADQINAQVPYELAGRAAVQVEVYVAGELRSRSEVNLQPAAPGIFTFEQGAGHAVAVNQDGRLNSPEQPAAPGSIITFYATGEGQTTPAMTSGRPPAAPLPKSPAPVAVRIWGLPAEVLYAGPAPGFAGLMQVNARVPEGFLPSGELSLELFVGGVASQRGVTVSVQ